MVTARIRVLSWKLGEVDMGDGMDAQSLKKGWDSSWEMSLDKSTNWDACGVPEGVQDCVCCHNPNA